MSISEQWKDLFTANYGSPRILLTEGKGLKVKDANGKVKATVTLTKMVDGKETIEEKVFEGDDLEVEAKIAELGK